MDETGGDRLNTLPSPDSVRIPQRVIDLIVAHARADAPTECCGLLVGVPGRIDRAVPTRNLARSPTRYQVDPRQHLELTRSLRGTGRAVVGAYHSHPHSDAVPSQTDLAEAYYPEFSYVIVSLRGASADVQAYRMSGGAFERIRIVSVGDNEPSTAY